MKGRNVLEKVEKNMWKRHQSAFELVCETVHVRVKENAWQGISWTFYLILYACVEPDVFKGMHTTKYLH